jgi:hypothetical protein
MLAIDLSHIAFIMLRYIRSIPSFLRAFIMKWCWILTKTYSASIEMIKWFLSLLLLMCYITYYILMCWFALLSHPCIPGMKLTLLWWMIILICCWIQFAIILLRIFALMIIKEIGL